MFDAISNVGSFTPQAPQPVAPSTVSDVDNLPTASEIAAHSPAAAVYFSPATIDPLSHTVIYEQRDPKTGSVINQYPTQKVVDQYRRAREEGGGSTAPVAAPPVVPVKSAPEPVAAAPAESTPAPVTVPVTVPVTTDQSA